MSRNPSAFPQSEIKSCSACGWYENEIDRGISLRDYFAAKAVTGMLLKAHTGDDFSIDDLARRVYKIADAMLAEREKSNQ